MAVVPVTSEAEAMRFWTLFVEAGEAERRGRLSGASAAERSALERTACAAAADWVVIDAERRERQRRD